MRGSKQERPPGSGHWRLRVYVGRDGRGNPVQVTETFYGSTTQADTALAKLVARCEHRSVPARRGPYTVARLLADWLAATEPTASAYYAREARRRIERRLVPAFGQVRAERLSLAQVEATYDAWIRAGLSPSTVKGIHAVLRAAYRDGLRLGRVSHDPLERIKLPSVPRARTRAPSGAELRAMIEGSLQDDPLLAFAIGLAATTGMRRGELAALRWSDVDLDRGVIAVSRALTVIGRRWSEGPTKSHAERLVHLDAAAKAILVTRRAHQEALAEHAEVVLTDDPFVLSRRADGSTPCLPDGLTHAFESLCDRLDLPAGHGAAYRQWLAGRPAKGARRPVNARPFHLHELRHFAGSYALEHGHDVVSVARRLGHSDPSVTLRWYAHAVDSRDRDVAGTLGRAITGGAQGDA